MNQQSKKKTIYTALAIFTLMLSHAFYLYQKMEKRTLLVIRLTNSSNVSVSHTPPKWITKAPQFIRKFLHRSFPVNIDYNSMENVDLLSTTSEQKEISLEKFIKTIKELENIDELVLNLQETTQDETLFFIDDLVELNHVKRLRLYANRLALTDQAGTSLQLEECYLSVKNMTPAVLRCLSKSNSLKKLLIKSLTPMSTKHLTYLHSLNKLESLMIENLQAKSHNLLFLKKFKQLKFLSISTPDRDIFQEDNIQGQSLAKYFDLSENLEIITSLTKLQKIEANIFLNKDNLHKLLKLNKIPISYYDLPDTIDDDYLKLFGAFLSKISPEEEFLKFGLVDKLATYKQKGITDKSLPFFKKYCPANLDLRGTSLKDISQLPLQKPTKIFFSGSTYDKNIITKLNRQEYEILDFSNTSFGDQDLQQLLTQTMPRVLHLNNTNISDKAIDMLMEFYDEHPKERLKVSFGERPLPENKRLLFLKRVHQWGMLQVFSSHLDPEVSFPTWAMHTSKKIVHDKANNLEGIDEHFPQLSSINFTGIPLTEKDWHSLRKLRLLHTISVHSAQNSEAISQSGILDKIHKLEIKTKPHSPILLSTNLESCHVALASGKNLIEYILTDSLPRKLTITGHGSISLRNFQENSNLRELIIGPHIKVNGTFPALDHLSYLKCESELSEDTLKSIGKLPKLQKLSANFNLLTNTILQEWSTLPQLMALDLSTATKLNNETFTNLTGFPTLEILSLPQNESINSRTLTALSKIQSLYKLNINGTLIPSKAIADKYEPPLLWDFLP